MSGNGDRLGRNLGAARLDEELSTADVKLWVAIRRGVKGEELRTSEVVAALKARGELDRQAAVLLDESLCAPFAGALIIALVPDFEPSVSGS